ncbi:MAG: plastocyanin/azurin family copper-binding protein [Pseudomonadota bacterium]
MKPLKCALAASGLLVASFSTLAEEHQVQAVVTQWKPLVLFAKPGDTVKFMTMAGHDTEAIEGMIPEGAEGWKSTMGQEGFSITVEKEGAYIYKCNPHITTGMVGAIVVGDANPPANLADLEANIGNVKVGGNMVKRTIRKMKKALEAKAQ